MTMAGRVCIAGDYFRFLNNRAAIPSERIPRPRRRLVAPQSGTVLTTVARVVMRGVHM
jgi:hypothetical protein